ncbi:hypothetical protein ACFE04_014453 [Oxalis oulophora]
MSTSSKKIDSIASSDAVVDYASWKVSHPPALDIFDEIFQKTKGKQIALFLDYDGTLAGIVDDPAEAKMTRKMYQVLRDVANSYPTSIITGRSVMKAKEFLKLENVNVSGSHGLDVQLAQGVGGSQKTIIHQPAAQFLPKIAEILKELHAKTQHINGCIVEDNKFCASVHYRMVTNQSEKETVKDIVKAVLNDFNKKTDNKPMKLSGGKMVLNQRRAEGMDGIGIVVSDTPKETSSMYSLRNPKECNCSTLISPYSDHSPILITSEQDFQRWRRHRFRFENSWFLEPNLFPVIATAWSSHSLQDIVYRLSTSSTALQQWSRARRIDAGNIQKSLEAKLLRCHDLIGSFEQADNEYQSARRELQGYM